MTDYTKTTNFTAKDSLSTGDPNKVIKGAEHDTEFDNIETAIATKLDSSRFPNLTGNVTATQAELNLLDGVTSTTTEINKLDGVSGALAGNYQSVRKQLDGDFDAIDGIFERIGNIVVFTVDANQISHSSGSTASTSAGWVPTAFRPSNNVDNVYYHDGSSSALLIITGAGTLSVNYRDWAGSTTAETSSFGPTITYVITGNVS